MGSIRLRGAHPAHRLRTKRRQKQTTVLARAENLTEPIATAMGFFFPFTRLIVSVRSVHWSFLGRWQELSQIRQLRLPNVRYWHRGYRD